MKPLSTVNRQLSTLLLLLAIPVAVPAFSQNADSLVLRFSDRPLVDSLMTRFMPQWKSIHRNAKAYRLQIILTTVTRDARGRAALETSTFRNKPEEYFYPASCVKLPTAIVALEKLRTFPDKGVSLDSPLGIRGGAACMREVNPRFGSDATSLRRYLTLALVVSDNDAYNRLFQFAGRGRIMDRMGELGYRSSRIVQMFNGCSLKAVGMPPRFTLYSPDGDEVASSQEPPDPREYAPPFPRMTVTKAIPLADTHGSPTMNYSRKNALPLQTLHALVARVVFPGLYPPAQQFRIMDEDYALLKRLMTVSPKEAGLTARRGDSSWHETLTNYLYYGSARGSAINPDLKICNIVGSSSGFLTDCAYFEDRLHNVEFILSAALYVGYDGLAREGEKFYYHSGLPFLRDLGRAVYEWQKELHK